MERLEYRKCPICDKRIRETRGILGQGWGDVERRLRQHFQYDHKIPEAEAYRQAHERVTDKKKIKSGKNRGDKMSSKLNKYKVLYALPRDSRQHQLTVMAVNNIAAKHAVIKRIKGCIVYGITLIEEKGEKVEYPKRRWH